MMPKSNLNPCMIVSLTDRIVSNSQDPNQDGKACKKSIFKNHDIAMVYK